MKQHNILERQIRKKRVNQIVQTKKEITRETLGNLNTTATGKICPRNTCITNSCSRHRESSTLAGILNASRSIISYGRKNTT
jgi:hypothetical protein